MDQTPYNLDQIRRDIVLEAIREVCGRRGWGLLAAHVRSNHVHTVVQAEVPPERVMNGFKAYASRRLNRMRLDEPDRKQWARHGSTRFLWEPEHILAALQHNGSNAGDSRRACAGRTERFLAADGKYGHRQLRALEDLVVIGADKMSAPSGLATVRALNVACATAPHADTNRLNPVLSNHEASRYSLK